MCEWEWFVEKDAHWGALERAQRQASIDLRLRLDAKKTGPIVKANPLRGAWLENLLAVYRRVGPPMPFVGEFIGE